MTYRTGLLPAALLMLPSAVVAQDNRTFPEPPPGSRFIGAYTTDRGFRQLRKISYTLRSDPAPIDEDDDSPPERPQAAIRLNLQEMELEPENYDRFLFADALTEEDRRSQLDGLLTSRVEVAIRTHRLADAERAKLLLAGKGDIKRFFDRVEAGRRDFDVARKSFNPGYQALLGLGPLTQLYREGPFYDGSLYEKTLQTILKGKKVAR
jgi:hypothetical protein